MTPKRNPRLAGFVALDGQARYGVQDLSEGCRRATAAGAPTGGGAHAAIGLLHDAAVLKAGEAAVMVLTAGSARKPADAPLPPLSVTAAA